MPSRFGQRARVPPRLSSSHHTRWHGWQAVEGRERDAPSRCLASPNSDDTRPSKAAQPSGRKDGANVATPPRTDSAEAGGNGTPDDAGPPDSQPRFVRLVLSAFRVVVRAFVRVFEAIGRSSPGRLISFAVFMALCHTLFHGAGGAAATAPVEVLYSQFIQLTKAGVVHSVLVDDQASMIHFMVDQNKLRELNKSKPRWWRPRLSTNSPTTVTKSGTSLKSFSTRIIDRDTSYVKVLIDNGVQFGARKQTIEGIISKSLGGFLALWIPLLPFFFLFKRVMDIQGGKTKDTKQSFDPPDTTFADVAGVDVVKAELQEAVQCLRDPARFERLNAQMPSGVLLSGPPGTGKTLLARAVAGEAGVPFFAVSASEFVEMFVGRGAARIRELFAQARKAAPAVIFIDELDAVGSQRGLGVNDERDQTLNQLLTELDGFERRPSILLLAATNRPEVLDKALLRPGRISRRIIVPLPDEQGRRDILAVHLRNIPMASEELKQAAIVYLASIAAGFSGAQLFNVVNEGALLTARRDGEVVELADLIMGVQRTRFGVNTAQPLSSLWEKLVSGFQGRKPEPARALPLY